MLLSQHADCGRVTNLPKQNAEKSKAENKKPSGVQTRSLRSLPFKQHAQKLLSSSCSPAQNKQLSASPASFFFFFLLLLVVACMRLGYRVRCARLLDGPAPCVLAKMLHTETLFLPLQSRQQGLRTPKVFIQEWKPRGDFHQLDARLRLLVYYVSADTTPLMEQGFVMVTQTRRWRRGCVIIIIIIIFIFYFFVVPKKG